MLQGLPPLSLTNPFLSSQNFCNSSGLQPLPTSCLSSSLFKIFKHTLCLHFMKAMCAYCKTKRTKKNFEKQSTESLNKKPNNTCHLYTFVWTLFSALFGGFVTVEGMGPPFIQQKYYVLCSLYMAFPIWHNVRIVLSL